MSSQTLARAQKEDIEAEARGGCDIGAGWRLGQSVGTCPNGSVGQLDLDQVKRF